MSTKRSRRCLFSRAGTASRRQFSFSHFRYCGAQFVRKMVLQGVSNCALDDIRAVIRAARLQAANSYRTEACFLWNFVLQLDACSLKFCLSFFKSYTEEKYRTEISLCTRPLHSSDHPRETRSVSRSRRVASEGFAFQDQFSPRSPSPSSISEFSSVLKV